jgi:hypothetical protein
MTEIINGTNESKVAEYHEERLRFHLSEHGGLLCFSNISVGNTPECQPYLKTLRKHIAGKPLGKININNIYSDPKLLNFPYLNPIVKAIRYLQFMCQLDPKNKMASAYA